MKIVFLDRYSLGDSDMSPVASLGAYAEYGYTEPGQILERAQNAQVIITNKVVIDSDIMDKLPELKLICVAATGINNVDTEHAKKSGIKVMNVAGYSTESVAEATFSMVLGLMRHTVYYDRYVKSGRYSTSARSFDLRRPVSEIRGKEWGIIGLGTIGQRVAELAVAFGAKVSYYSTSGLNKNETYPSLALGELLSCSDIVTIHAPLNEKTEGLLGYGEIKQMKPTAILVNVGRGGIIVESDLAKALNDRLIAGAALDVFANEPLEKTSPLLTLDDSDSFLAAPHCAWSSDTARKTLVSALAGNIREFFKL